MNRRPRVRDYPVAAVVAFIVRSTEDDHETYRWYLSTPTDFVVKCRLCRDVFRIEEGDAHLRKHWDAFTNAQRAALAAREIELAMELGNA